MMMKITYDQLVAINVRGVKYIDNVFLQINFLSKKLCFKFLAYNKCLNWKTDIFRRIVSLCIIFLTHFELLHSDIDEKDTIKKEDKCLGQNMQIKLTG